MKSKNNGRYCKHCKEVEPSVSLMKSSKRTLQSGGVKQYFLCTKCNLNYSKQYRAHGGMKKMYESTKKYRENNKEKLYAHVKSRGIELLPCEVCGTVYNIHRHHDDYSKPVEVRFLCSFHHKQLHIKIKSGKK